MNNRLAASLMMFQLMQKFGSSVIPYATIAKEFLGWTAPKTAMARLNDGTTHKLGLLVIRPTKGVAFVMVSDLVDFLLKNRNVEISNNQPSD
ncbi:pyocin activator PrtN family protein [Aliiglaciecola sp. NS0011-25]|uniref:pyocin activator PrtN family protein n=1 Tax=Aliiglaciecola sp. NS0011-25 TaxID=3127654 RepID=UPI00310644BD